MPRDKADEPVDDDERREEGHHRSDRQSRQIGGDKLLADIPLGRVAMPDEVATMASFCAIDAPPSMTGAVLDVNGASYVR